MRYFVYFDSITGRALLIRIDKITPRPGVPSPLRNVGSPRTSSGEVSRGRSTPIAAPQREDECQRSLAQEAQVPDSPPENSSEADQAIIDRHTFQVSKQILNHTSVGQSCQELVELPGQHCRDTGMDALMCLPGL